MQRFGAGELATFETYLEQIGFKPTEVKVHEKEPNPPLATYVLEGRGKPEEIHRLLLESPFLLTEFSARKVEKGTRVRLVVSRREITEGQAQETAPEFGDAERYGAYRFESEMGE